MNNPDLIVFIGEALVGNDGMDQLVKFNKALIDLSPRDKVREIDAIILSKFDTVDDKGRDYNENKKETKIILIIPFELHLFLFIYLNLVGAALSMTYNTGKPILFCGIGQKYPHLKKLNVRTIVRALMD